MSRLSLDAATIRKLVAAARLLESDKPCEVRAAALACRRLTNGVSIADLLEGALTPTPRPVTLGAERSVWDIRTDPLCPWRNTARAVAERRAWLSEREFDFVMEMAGRRQRPTPRQQSWLDALAVSVEMRQAA